jgi:undecaprenyl-diphosphatase
MPPPPEDPTVDRVLSEPPDQRFIGDRDLTAWPTTTGTTLARLARRLRRRLAPHNVLIIILIVGLGMVAAMTAAAGAVYDAVTEADGIAALDRPTLDAAKTQRTPLLTPLMQAYTTLGGPIGMPILATLVAVGLTVWWRQWTPLLLVAITAAGSLALTVVGKAAVGRTRPPLIDAVPPYEISASFPSGHTLNSAALAGIVAYLLIRRQQQRWARNLTVGCAALFTLTMGLTRVYLGHHWLTDVVVAWALGLAWLAAVITAHRLLLTLRTGR